jgi:hypothetical protein
VSCPLELETASEEFLQVPAIALALLAIKKLTLTAALTSERKLAQGRPLRHRLSFNM